MPDAAGAAGDEQPLAAAQPDGSRLWWAVSPASGSAAASSKDEPGRRVREEALRDRHNSA